MALKGDAPLGAAWLGAMPCGDVGVSRAGPSVLVAGVPGAQASLESLAFIGIGMYKLPGDSVSLGILAVGGVGWGMVGCGAGEGHGAEKCPPHLRRLGRTLWRACSQGGAGSGWRKPGLSLGGGGGGTVQISLDLALWKGAPACPSQNQDST